MIMSLWCPDLCYVHSHTPMMTFIWLVGLVFAYYNKLYGELLIVNVPGSVQHELLIHPPIVFPLAPASHLSSFPDTFFIAF